MKRFIALLLLCTFASSNVAVAGAIEQQQNQIIQQQQQRQQELQDSIKQQQQNRQSIDVEPPADTDKTFGGPCFNMSTITLDGAAHLPASVQQSLTQPFINECIDLDKINQLLKEISQWYYEQGYVTSRAYVAAQDLGSGQLMITVIEGVIEAYQLTDPESGINTATAFPSATGDLLNLRDIEQGLEQINRLQSNQATMEIVPGEVPGASVINIKSETSKPWAVSLTHDNTGQPSTGELMNGLLIGLDNPLGLNDFTYLNYQTESTSIAGKNSESIGWHWDMPFGYWNAGIDINYFEYLSIVGIIGNNFESSGTSLSQSLYLSRVMYRDQNSKLTLRSSLERKKLENFIEDVLLEPSSRILGIGNIGLAYDVYTKDQSQWQLAFNYYRGLHLFDAPNDRKQAIGTPKAQFEKFFARVDYQKNGTLTLAEKTQLPLALHSSFNVQYSGDRLFGSEQMSIGSLFTVRGYKNNSVSAASGAYWRNTLTAPIRTAWGGQFLQSISPFVAYDIGAIRDKDGNFGDKKHVKLEGWSTGVEFSGNHYSAKLVYAKPVNTPRNLQFEEEQWYFNVSTSF